MIECRNCKSPQFVQITHSELNYKEDNLRRIVELYECTMCGSIGRYIDDGNEATLSDTFVKREKRPL